jgi:hypothetical protein
MDRTRGRLAHAESSPARLSLIRVSEPQERVVARRDMIASCRHSAMLSVLMVTISRHLCTATFLRACPAKSLDLGRMKSLSLISSVFIDRLCHYSIRPEKVKKYSQTSAQDW